MSALDEMEERNQRLAYERGLADGAKQERERVLTAIKHLVEYNDDLFQYIGNQILPQKVVAYDFLMSDEGIESLRGHEGGQQHTGDMSDLELVEGRLEGLQILLSTPANKKTMTDYRFDKTDVPDCVNEMFDRFYPVPLKRCRYCGATL